MSRESRICPVSTLCEGVRFEIQRNKFVTQPV